jgi:hypothetical protein
MTGGQDGAKPLAGMMSAGSISVTARRKAKSAATSTYATSFAKS